MKKYKIIIITVATLIVLSFAYLLYENSKYSAYYISAKEDSKYILKFKENKSLIKNNINNFKEYCGPIYEYSFVGYDDKERIFYTYISGDHFFLETEDLLATDIDMDISEDQYKLKKGDTVSISRNGEEITKKVTFAGYITGKEVDNASCN